MGTAGDRIDPGLRAGLLLGGRASDAISANAELLVDLVNPNTASGVSTTEFMFDLTFSPLLHAWAGNGAQFVIGPRLGLWYLTESASASGISASAWGWGWTVGANAGVLAPMGNAHAGILLGFGVRDPATVCVSFSGQSEMCTSENLVAAKILGISLVVMP